MVAVFVATVATAQSGTQADRTMREGALPLPELAQRRAGIRESQQQPYYEARVGCIREAGERTSVPLRWHAGGRGARQG
jgi:hypothetical protein